jgi:polysaccharide biosynthesis protein PslH
LPRRIRILWLSHLLPWPPKGGLRQRSYYLMREVARRHDVRLIAFRQRTHQFDDSQRRQAIEAMSEFASVSSVIDLPQDRGLLGNVRLALRSLLPGPPFTIRWGTCSSYAEAVRTAVAGFRPEVVHFDTISLAPYLQLVAGIPKTLNHHNVESHMLLRRATRETNPAKRVYFWQEGKRLARYERQVSSKFQMHLVCADLDGERLRATVGDIPIEVVPNGVDLEYFQPAAPGLPQDPNTMVFVGGLSWYPNLSAIRFFLARVWPILCEKCPTIEFRIIGRNPPSDLREFARRDTRLKVLGFVDDIRPMVHRSSVYVCPIFDGGGTKLKMLDAMAMGKAIVAHPVATEGLGLRHGEDVLMAEGPAAFAAHVLSLLEDASNREALGRSARDVVEERFGFDAIGRRLAGLYASLACDGQSGLGES